VFAFKVCKKCCEIEKKDFYNLVSRPLMIAKFDSTVRHICKKNFPERHDKRSTMKGKKRFKI
jgi:hypothetical protein